MTPGTMQDGLLIFTVPTLLHLTSRQRPKTFVDSKLIHLFFSLAVNSKLYNIRPRIQLSQIVPRRQLHARTKFRAFRTDRQAATDTISDITNTVSFHMHDRSRMQRAIA